MADPALDTSATIEIRAAPGRLALMALGALAFVGAGVFLVWSHGARNTFDAWLAQAVGYAAIAFFGTGFVVLTQRFFKQRETVVTLSPDGLKDIRVSPDLIPWSAVASLNTWQMYGQQVMVVGLKPGEEEKLTLNRMARMTRGANASL
jgi:hypothetical protein